MGFYVSRADRAGEFGAGADDFGIAGTRAGGDSRSLSRLVPAGIFLGVPAFAFLLAVSPIVSLVWLGHYEPIFVLFVALLAAGWLVSILSNPAYVVDLGTGALRWVSMGCAATAILNPALGYLAGRYLGGAAIVAVSAFSLILGYVIVLAAYHLENRVPFGQLAPRDAGGIVLASVVGLGIFLPYFSRAGSRGAVGADCEWVVGCAADDRDFADVGASDAETVVELGVFAVAGLIGQNGAGEMPALKFNCNCAHLKVAATTSKPQPARTFLNTASYGPEKLTHSRANSACGCDINESYKSDLVGMRGAAADCGTSGDLRRLLAGWEAGDGAR